MTSQTPPAEDKRAAQFTLPLRELVAFVLLGATALGLLVALVRLVPASFAGGAEGYLDYASGTFPNFVGLETILFPLVAVLLAAHIEPRVARAKAITLIALVEIGIAALFGLLVGTLAGFLGDITDTPRLALEGLLLRIAQLAVLGVVGFVIIRIWQGLFVVPKPVGPPPGYGQPGYGQPPYPGQQPQYPGQAAHYPPPGYPAVQQQPGYPPAGYPGAPQQPGYPPQPAPGYPAYPTGYAAPQPGFVAPTSAAPASGAPASGVPASGAPASGAPASGAPAAPGAPWAPAVPPVPAAVPPDSAPVTAPPAPAAQPGPPASAGPSVPSAPPAASGPVAPVAYGPGSTDATSAGLPAYGMPPAAPGGPYQPSPEAGEVFQGQVVSTPEAPEDASKPGNEATFGYPISASTPPVSDTTTVLPLAQPAPEDPGAPAAPLPADPTARWAAPAPAEEAPAPPAAPAERTDDFQRTQLINPSSQQPSAGKPPPAKDDPPEEDDRTAHWRL